MKNKKAEIINGTEFASLYEKSKRLIDSARNNMGQMANSITVITSFLLGHYIVEQQGQERAKYGSKIIDSLSAYLTPEPWICGLLSTKYSCSFGMTEQ